ncbi:DUF2177 family protein [Variovorax guangxiensis]|uniref:DUF2177 family protein n=1 Tax=Variovorax guangxiensis TaxID=1775474 RepID=A0A502E1K7_9BURK|nr:DUF2177 family protein [Variovorax guangxiensis]RZI64744.1 MAG: DUF2177 family protein [Variovorax sp.]TPG26565.1 DUF2177 family protein [Variovorax ginsengisoli]TPG30290.1 DUF2177 family protein [Variovorax guangxiensis]
MSIRQISIAYVSTAVVFLALDAVWLGTMADRLYRPAIGHLMADRFSLAPAVLFYLLYVAGAVVFAVMPALASGRWTTALGLGALLGLLAYATYDLTNQATLKDWSWTVTIADLCWGTFVTAVSAAAAARITMAFGGR